MSYLSNTYTIAEIDNAIKNDTESVIKTIKHNTPNYIIAILIDIGVKNNAFKSVYYLLNRSNSHGLSNKTINEILENIDIFHIVENCHFTILDWLYSFKYNLDYAYMMNLAMAKGSIPLITWILEKDPTIGNIDVATLSGNIELCEYLKEKGGTFTEHALVYAVKSNLKMFKYIYKQVEYSMLVLEEALKDNNRDIVMYLRDKGRICDSYCALYIKDSDLLFDIYTELNANIRETIIEKFIMNKELCELREITKFKISSDIKHMFRCAIKRGYGKAISLIMNDSALSGFVISIKNIISHTLEHDQFKTALALLEKGITLSKKDKRAIIQCRDMDLFGYITENDIFIQELCIALSFTNGLKKLMPVDVCVPLFIRAIQLGNNDVIDVLYPHTHVTATVLAVAVRCNNKYLVKKICNELPGIYKCDAAAIAIENNNVPILKYFIKNAPNVSYCSLIDINNDGLIIIDRCVEAAIKANKMEVVLYLSKIFPGVEQLIITHIATHNNMFTYK